MTKQEIVTTTEVIKRGTTTTTITRREIKDSQPKKIRTSLLTPTELQALSETGPATIKQILKSLQKNGLAENSLLKHLDNLMVFSSIKDYLNKQFKTQACEFWQIGNFTLEINLVQGKVYLTVKKIKDDPTPNQEYQQHKMF